MIRSTALPFQIKICGLTQPQHALDAKKAGADAIGLNFFKSSIRFVSPQQAAVIAAAARCRTPQQPDRSPRIVGVFVNHSLEQIFKLTTSLMLDGIQLHGEESVNFFTELRSLIHNEFDLASRPFFVRALTTQSSGDRPDFDRDVETDRITHQIRSWSESGVDTILLDAAATGEFGGTGKTIDWSLMPQLQTFASRPLALAGGLNPTNIASAVKTSQVNIVDVASGVESPLGVKCPMRVRKFVQQARIALSATDAEI